MVGVEPGRHHLGGAASVCAGEEDAAACGGEPAVSGLGGRGGGGL